MKQVLRDTTWQEIDEEDLVVGDIIRYRKPGSIFAADIVVISVDSPVVCKGDESFGDFFCQDLGSTGLFLAP
jgi:magnesium-transporting ATPase (P-type)